MEITNTRIQYGFSTNKDPIRSSRNSGSAVRALRRQKCCKLNLYAQ